MRLIFVAASAFEMGQFAFAVSASFANASASMPGTSASVSRSMPVIANALDLVHVPLHRRVHARRRMARARQAGGQRHGKAVGVRRAQPLFRVRAGAALEARHDADASC